jgi:hypothetical protein
MNPSAVSKEESLEDQKTISLFWINHSGTGIYGPKERFLLFSIMVNNEKELSYEELYCLQSNLRDLW